MASTVDETPFTPLRALERHLVGGLLASAVAVLLVVARNSLVPRAGPPGFGLVFWGWLALFYVAGALALWIAGGLLGHFTGRPAVSRALAAAVALGWLLSALFLNPRALRMMTALEGPLRFRGLCLAGLVLCASALVLAAVLAPRRAPAFRLCAALGLGLTAAGLSPAATVAPPAPAAVRPDHIRTPLVVVGLDGADWRYIEPLIARGKLPHLAALRSSGAWGPLRTLRPTLSPAIWNTIATGVPPRRPGIRGFTGRTLNRVPAPLPPLHALRALGFGPLLGYLERSREIADTPISSLSRRVPAFWNIATVFGAPVTVVNWWATWPVDPVLGSMVSDRSYYEELVSRDRRARPRGLVFPPELDEVVAHLTVLPQDVTREQVLAFAEATPEEFARMQVRHPSPLTGIEHELTYYLSTHETNRRSALRLTEEGRRRFGFPPDLLLLLRIVDKTCHTALVFSELVDDHRDASPEELRRFSRVVTAAYEAADRALGDVEAAFPGANVVVVSDHGFGLEDGAYDHAQSPDGIFLAAGPAFRRGRIEDLSVYDMLPLMLQAKGFPLADDLEGTLPAAAFRPEFLAAHPLQRVASYSAHVAVRAQRGSREGDAEMMEMLRALGYLD